MQKTKASKSHSGKAIPEAATAGCAKHRRQLGRNVMAHGSGAGAAAKTKRQKGERDRKRSSVIAAVNRPTSFARASGASQVFVQIVPPPPPERRREDAAKQAPSDSPHHRRHRRDRREDVTACDAVGLSQAGTRERVKGPIGNGVDAEDALATERPFSPHAADGEKEGASSLAVASVEALGTVDNVVERGRSVSTSKPKSESKPKSKSKSKSRPKSKPASIPDGVADALAVDASARQASDSVRFGQAALAEMRGKLSRMIAQGTFPGPLPRLRSCTATPPSTQPPAGGPGGPPEAGPGSGPAQAPLASQATTLPTITVTGLAEVASLKAETLESASAHIRCAQINSLAVERGIVAEDVRSQRGSAESFGVDRDIEVGGEARVRGAVRADSLAVDREVDVGGGIRAKGAIHAEVGMDCPAAVFGRVNVTEGVTATEVIAADVSSARSLLGEAWASSLKICGPVSAEKGLFGVVDVEGGLRSRGLITAEDGAEIAGGLRADNVSSERVAAERGVFETAMAVSMLLRNMRSGGGPEDASVLISASRETGAVPTVLFLPPDMGEEGAVLATHGNGRLYWMKPERQRSAWDAGDVETSAAAKGREDGAIGHGHGKGALPLSSAAPSHLVADASPDPAGEREDPAGGEPSGGYDPGEVVVIEADADGPRDGPCDGCNADDRCDDGAKGNGGYGDDNEECTQGHEPIEFAEFGGHHNGYDDDDDDDDNEDIDGWLDIALSSVTVPEGHLNAETPPEDLNPWDIDEILMAYETAEQVPLSPASEIGGSNGETGGPDRSADATGVDDAIVSAAGGPPRLVDITSRIVSEQLMALCDAIDAVASTGGESRSD